MSSNAAFVIFSAFILVGLLIEYRGRERVTSAAWLPLFWMSICASRSLSQWFNLSAPTKSGSPVDRVVLAIAILLGLIVILKRRERVAVLLKNNKALLVFTIYLGITVLWSDISAVSFKRWVRLFGHFVMAGVLMTEPDPVESIRSVFRRTAYILIPLSVMFIKYFPELGTIYTRMGGLLWTGAAIMKNGLGHLSFAFLFFIIWDAIYTRGKKAALKTPRLVFDGLILLMALWLLRGPGGAYSSASIGSLIFGTAVLIASRFAIVKRNFTKIGVIAIVAICLFVTLELSFGIIEIIVTSLGRNMTFTDRVPLWNTLLEMGLKKPFFGYGYGGFWSGEELFVYTDKRIFSFNQGHNGYLEIFVEGGLVAITLLGVLLFSVFRKIKDNGLIDYEFAIFRLSFLAMILLANVTESSFARERDLLTFVFYIIAFYCTMPKEKTPRLATGW